MEKTQKTLRELVDDAGANGFILIDDGNGSAGPGWIDWSDEIDAVYGNTIMMQANTTDKAYEQNNDGYDSDKTVGDVAKYVVRDYSTDEMYASDWIAGDNGYTYRIIF